MRVVVDTNVFVSGLLNRKGAPSKVVDAILEGLIIAVVSETTFAELEDVLRRPRLAPYFQKSNIIPDVFLENLKPCLEFLQVQPLTVDFEIRDDKDRPFLELAATPPQPDFLITGDKDFEQNHYASVPVIAVSQFVRQFI